MSATFRNDQHCRDLIEKAKSEEIPVHYLDRGYHTTLGDTEISVAGPGSEDDFIKSPLNNRSLVLSISSKGRSMLLTGDIERQAQKALLESGTALNHDVLKIPHHGSSTSFNKRFFRAVSPDLSLISVGKNNRFNFPSFRIVNYLEKNGSKIKRTDRDGAVEITFEKECLKIGKGKHR